MNHKKLHRIHRIYKEERLQLQIRRKKKMAVVPRVPLPKATRTHEKWSMDFIYDQLAGGKRYRVFTLVDTHTRECLTLHAGFSLRASDVVNVLSSLERKPKAIAVDNGSEFISKELELWAYTNGVLLDFIKRGKPVKNGYIESFNGKLRDECLNLRLFFSLREAQAELAKWKEEYNTLRPNTSLGAHPQGLCTERQTNGA